MGSIEGSPVPFSLAEPLFTPVAELLEHIKADPQMSPVLKGEVSIARAPGRLDVMGGIADYTGSLVCEMPLNLGTAVLAHRRKDRQLNITTYNQTDSTLVGPVTCQLSLDDFYGSGSLLPDKTVRRLFAGKNHWAAYIAGVFWVLGRHRHLTSRAKGADICCYSTVPTGSGLSSSAALEVAAIYAIAAAYRLSLDPADAAVLAQKVENQIAGAACGIMDQMTSSLGKRGQLLLLKCQPHTVIGFQGLPQGTTVAAIDSGVKHSVGGNAYTRTRVAAFMAHTILLSLVKAMGLKSDPTGGYLANISPANYHQTLSRILPDKLSGRDFIRRYRQTIDTVTQIDPLQIYPVRAAADHHVLENHRVHRFVEALKNAESQRQSSLLRAGRLMLASHASYGRRADLGSPETDWLVREIVCTGRHSGFYGAKITGGGSGGSVAVLMEDSPDLHRRLEEIVAAYRKKFNTMAAIIHGSGPSAAEFGTVMLADGKVVR